MKVIVANPKMGFIDSEDPKQSQEEVSDLTMGAKQSRLSDEDFLFLEEETGMSKTTLQVGKFRPEHKMIKFRPEHKMT